jgi:RHS repeat-associated protein
VTRIAPLAAALALAVSLAAAADSARECRSRNDSVPTSLGATGWAAVDGPVTGGCGATPSRVFTVHNRTELVNALTKGQFKGGKEHKLDHHSKIIYVRGTIDLNVDDANVALTEEDYMRLCGYSAHAAYYGAGGFFEAYTATYDPNLWIRQSLDPADNRPPALPTDDGGLESWRICFQKKQAERVMIDVGSNTSIIGVGADARIINGGLRIGFMNQNDANDPENYRAQNVVVRNVTFADAFDMFPGWDPKDSFSITITNQNGCQAVFVDENTGPHKCAFRGGRWNTEYDSISVMNAEAAAGRLTEKVLPNGIKVGYQYDDADGVLSIAYKKTDDTPIESVTYTYDAGGQRTSRGDGNVAPKDTTFSATYDEANRLTTITIAGEPFTLSYDDNGNLTSKSGATSGTTTYTWDARNRLIALSGPSGSATFKYDAFGRRIEKTVNGTTTGFIYDGAQALAELKGSALDTVYHIGFMIDEVLARYGSTNRTLLSDALMSVIAQAEDDQSVANFYAYSAYGEAAILALDQGNSLQYTGRENDQTGLYYYRARYYDPGLKRFITEDPIGIAGGINVYQYVGGDPISFTDPTGEIIPALVIVAALIAAQQSTSFQSAAASSAQSWANLQVQTGNPVYGVLGALAALADPCNINTTTAVLGAGAGAGGYLRQAVLSVLPGRKQRVQQCVSHSWMGMVTTVSSRTASSTKTRASSL